MLPIPPYTTSKTLNYNYAKPGRSLAYLVCMRYSPGLPVGKLITVEAGQTAEMLPELTYRFMKLSKKGRLASLFHVLSMHFGLQYVLYKPDCVDLTRCVLLSRYWATSKCKPDFTETHCHRHDRGNRNINFATFQTLTAEWTYGLG